MQQTGRSGAGNLRNFKQMSDAKLLGVLEAVIAEDNDPEAITAYSSEAASRGLSASDAPAPKATRTPREVSGPASPRVSPMLCAKSDDLPRGPWTYEVKWDGFRCVAVVEDGQVSLWSRSQKPLSFPHVEAALAGVADCVIDGELVVMTAADQGGDFQTLVDGHPSATLVAFDLISAAGNDTRGLGIEDRREMLAAIVADTDSSVVTVSPVYGEDEVDALLDAVGTLGLEGIVAKKNGSTYRDGTRGPSWIKFKVRTEQEFAVLGYTDGEGGMSGMIGALLLGYRDGDGFRYCGSVGTGWDRAEAARLTAEVKKVDAADASDYANLKKNGAHVIAPVLVVQVAFQRWTKDGHLWHPSYRGQRHDKAAADVVKES